MSNKEYYDKINEILIETDYPIRISNVGDIEDFLLDDSNRRFTEQYALIGRMFDEISGRPYIDRYPEPSVGKDEEEHKSAFNANTDINEYEPW